MEQNKKKANTTFWPFKGLTAHYTPPPPTHTHTNIHTHQTEIHALRTQKGSSSMSITPGPTKSICNLTGLPLLRLFHSTSFFFAIKCGLIIIA